MQRIAKYCYWRAAKACREAHWLMSHYPVGSLGWIKGDLWCTIGDMWAALGAAMLGD